MNQPYPLQLSEQTRSQRIAFIRADWHGDIVENCHASFLATLAERDFDTEQVDTFTVPGVFEIPLQAKLLAKSGRYAAIVASGFIVDGGIYRHDFVSTAVIDAMMALQMEQEVPMISAVLTPHHFHEHESHTAFFREHFLTKGREAAEACLQTMENLNQVRKLSER
ncbi:6,7-dimethyl-8-ribityllumazine synthase [Salinicola rhizosphaerae]|uniref:6,7-dimethyl-8-ribityllumazine synthase n=1 Tax=Salinicola rhizosphaerae TaxID=1443141 RepID=A0ABQ3EAU5_9GAMM|nr:6,7-dimethyl-8-ribityllumazine synthase [Salinicola rhizosphaerae]GHB31855.1 6,7-dimethyl-8-ribityllumazine synthase [Salinicola rhizosphaerae]